MVPTVTSVRFQSTHSLRSATAPEVIENIKEWVSIHALLAECDMSWQGNRLFSYRFNPRTPCGVRRLHPVNAFYGRTFQSTHSLRSATQIPAYRSKGVRFQSTHSLRSATTTWASSHTVIPFQSTHSLRSATRFPNRRFRYCFVSIHALLAECDATDFIHYYSTEQIILCANLPKKTVIARLHFLSIYLSIFYSQCITPIADLPGNSCELEVGAQAMFHSL